MTGPRRWAPGVLALALLAGVRCECVTRRAQPDDAGTSEGSGGATGGSGSTQAGTLGATSTTGPLECPPDEPDVCDGQCVNLLHSNEHCGECGHICREFNGSTVGICKWGQCEPTITGCLRPEDGFETCDEYCASLGEQCVERRNDPPETYPCGEGGTFRRDPDLCEDGYGDVMPIAFCADPIPWGPLPPPADDIVVEVVSCCCTQP